MPTPYRGNAGGTWADIVYSCSCKAVTTLQTPPYIVLRDLSVSTKLSDLAIRDTQYLTPGKQWAASEPASADDTLMEA